jgi:hypothetical protein
MTLRDALLADVERRGVRRLRYAIRPVSEGWMMIFRDGTELPYELAVSDVLAADWEVCS